ncbi:MAG: urease subunit beta [Treponema sp.]
MKIGEIISCNKEIELNTSRKTVTIKVTNTGDRPVQVGSHFHFFEVNKLLKFDRKEAFGYRLDIPSGMSVRFEPGETKTVHLCSFGGTSRIFGLNDLTQGQTSEANKCKALIRAEERGFITK